MAQALAWLITILVIVGVFWALVRDYDRRRARSAEEYEREVIEQRNSLLRAGLVDLDKFVGDERQKRAAVEYLKDEQRGMIKTGGKSDDVDRTAGDER
ncbi:MAG TPA: hypothetical protein VNN73_14420 [Blastocatellia bacterium]|nr:hypothetical protein [Blastocatellia bacterium]